MNILKKSIVTIGLILSLSTQVFATEALPKEPVLSPWAIKPVSEAQLQGLYPLNQEAQTINFTSEISSTDLEYLNKTAKTKLEEVKLKKNNKSFKPETSKNDNSREDVLINVYNIVGPYADDSGNGAVEYFKENNLINGDGNELGLDKKATIEQAITFYNRAVADVINDQNMGGKGVFYKIEANGNTVYLFGSIHVGDPSLYPIDSDIIEAYNKSNSLYVEADITDAEKVIASQQKLISDVPLDEQLGSELYQRYKTVMDKYQIPEEAYKNLKIWSAYNTLSTIPLLTEMPNGAAYGIDQYFLINAKLDQKEIKELESIDFQFDLLENFGNDKYLNLTKNLLDEIENNNSKESVELTKNMLKSWKIGDEKEFAKIFESQDDFTQYLVVDRDPEMANKIDEMLKSKDKKTYFVVAGSGHYAPKNSVLKYLTDKGYTVENLTGK